MSNHIIPESGDEVMPLTNEELANKIMRLRRPDGKVYTVWYDVIPTKKAPSN